MSVHKNKEELNVLLEQFQNGDQDAFDEIYRRCHGHIAFLCSKLCYNKEDAEEVVQDTFMTIFKKGDQLRGDTLLALMRKIAANGCYDKRKKSEREHFAYLDETMDVADLDEDFLPEEYLQNKELQEELLRIINELHPTQREMVYMYYYAEINSEEIGKLLDIPSVRVRKILCLARQKIKSKLSATAATASVSLGAVLFIEAEIFAAGYVGAALAGVGVAAAATTAITTNIFTIAACVAAAGAIATAVYFTVLPGANTYEVYEPPTEIYVTQAWDEPTAYEPDQPTEEPTEAYTEEPTEPPTYTPEEAEPTADDPTDTPADDPTPVEQVLAAAAEPEPYTPTPAEEPDIPEPTEEPTQAPTEEPEALPPPPPLPLPPVQDTQPAEQELAAAQEPEIEEEPTPEPTDRTPQILAALAAATTPAEVDTIIRNYGFTHVSQLQRASGEVYLFYVRNDGSGDIFVGTAVQEDGSGWRMRFEHFNNGQRPTDALDLFDWMGA